jgi:hypothetical protein
MHGYTYLKYVNVLRNDVMLKGPNSDIVNCNWVDTRWQQYITHLHTNSTQNNTKKQKQYIEQHKKQYIEQHKNIWNSAGRAPSWRVIP